MVPISILLLGAISAATLYAAIVQVFRLRSRENFDLQELNRRSEQLCDAIERLPELQGKERRAACRAIARAMRRESSLLLGIINDWFYDRSQTNVEIVEPAIAACREAWQLLWMVARILFLMRFAPSLLEDCHRLREAVLQFGRMWIAFFRLCQAQYPEELGDLELPEF